MPYSKQTWQNGVSQTTDTRMGHMEDGIETAQAAAEAASAAVTAHAEATDPHPQYLTAADADGAYQHTILTFDAMPSSATLLALPDGTLFVVKQ